MFANFPVLSEERIKEYTDKGYVLVFRLMRAINEERPKDIITKFQLETEERWKGGDPITKIIPFDEGYDFLKNSDTQYNIRFNFGSELMAWSLFYNISIKTNEADRKEYLGNVDTY